MLSPSFRKHSQRHCWPAISIWKQIFAISFSTRVKKRLARVLLKLNRLGQHADMPQAKMPRLSHETLAEMVGTTRSRITFFMKKIRKLGLIEYRGTGDITVREELIADIVLHD